jgi:hypothetical protein
MVPFVLRPSNGSFLHTWDPNCPTMEHQKDQLGKQFKFHPYDSYVWLMVEP